MHNQPKATVEVKINDKDHERSGMVCRVGPIQEDGTVWVELEDQGTMDTTAVEVNFHELQLAVETVKKSATMACYQRGLC